MHVHLILPALAVEAAERDHFGEVLALQSPRPDPVQRVAVLRLLVQQVDQPLTRLRHYAEDPLELARRGPIDGDPAEVEIDHLYQCIGALDYIRQHFALRQCSRHPRLERLIQLLQRSLGALASRHILEQHRNFAPAARLDAKCGELEITTGR
jgi:hypothetical protein